MLLVGMQVATVVALFGALSWFWCIWPAMTLREFAARVERGDLDGANGLLAGNARWLSDERGMLVVYDELGLEWATLWRLDRRQVDRLRNSPLPPSQDGTPVVIYPPLPSNIDMDAAPWFQFDSGDSCGEILPRHVWQLWFDPQVIEWVQPTRSERLSGRQCCKVWHGRYELVARFGRVAVVDSHEGGPVNMNLYKNWDGPPESAPRHYARPDEVKVRVGDRQAETEYLGP